MASESIHHRVEEIARDIARLRIAFVNTYFVGIPSQRGATDATPWVLIDAGLSLGARRIIETAAERFGRDSRPAAIILTHAHFDHVGALPALIEAWQTPVYAHHMELPYLTGRADYPPPDPTVGRGLMARMSPLFPESGIDISGSVHELPRSGSVPGMPGWRWIPTPGHAPGHVSLFRDSDRTLIAGDAVTTTRQESVFAVVTQRQELNGPPAYFTIDWDAARRSVATLASLKPRVIASGHGEPMNDAVISSELEKLALDFERRARPRRGRYVRQAAVVDGDGFVVAQPAVTTRAIRWGAVAGVAGAVAGAWLIRRYYRGAAPASSHAFALSRKD